MDTIKSILKLVIAIILTIGLAFCLRTCLIFYLDYPTYTDIAMVNQQDAIFPAVTLCPDPDSKIKVKEDVLKVIRWF